MMKATILLVTLMLFYKNFSEAVEFLNNEDDYLARSASLPMANYTSECPLGRMLFELKLNEILEIRSPGYGSMNYEDRYRCKVSVRPANKDLMLKFDTLKMDLEDSSNCRKDRVALRQKGKDILRICGSSKATGQFSDRVNFLFKTSKFVNATGFKVRFQAFKPEITTESTSLTTLDSKV